LSDEAKLDDLVEVAQRTREAILDYAQLSPLEEKLVRRFLFTIPEGVGDVHGPLRP
jgi:hypothetical protein